MKIGILTFQNTTNYGALFQMYALQEAMKCLGSECEVIDYHCQAVEEREKIAINFSSVKDFTKSLILYIPNKEKAKNFGKFMKKYVCLSKKEYTKNSANKMDEAYDRFVVGSDQVWNTNLSGNDYTYFLDFCKNTDKKFSYAASFGASAFEQYIERFMAKYLESFSLLCIREKQGANLVKTLTGRTGIVALDPTFLLTKNQWKVISRESKTDEKDKYILAYLLKKKKKSVNYVKALAKKMNCRVKYVNISPRYELGVDNIYTASPQQFLNLLYHARFVVTGSYHGMVLSINMNKQFVYEVSSNKNNYNSRMETVVELFGLKDRLVNYHKFEYPAINYKGINQCLEEKRIESYEILKKICGENNG